MSELREELDAIKAALRLILEELPFIHSMAYRGCYKEPARDIDDNQYYASVEWTEWADEYHRIGESLESRIDGVLNALTPAQVPPQ